MTAPLIAAVSLALCPVTVPNPGPAGEHFNFGNDRIRAELYWPNGTLLAGVLPDGGVMATVGDDGSIWAKLGWWRGEPGRLRITGRRLDAPAPPLRADVPNGYGDRGFQATGLSFPTLGCWQVVGRVGRASLSFVVLVKRVPRYTRAPARE